MGLFGWISSIFRRKPATPAIPVARPTPNDRALLVGINAYPGGNELRGCVNDALSVKAYLLGIGFLEQNIVVLLDADATTANILARMDWLAGCPSGARAYFHYSGHGAQYATGNPNDPQGMSDVICPVDFDWSPQFMITDLQFVSAFSKMAPGVLFNWGSDSCHSGDLEREFEKGRRKMMPAPLHVTAAIAAARGMGMSPRGMVHGELDVGFISGCRSDQTSADTNENGQPCGALTFFMLKQMRASPAGISIKNLTAKIVADLAAHGYEQVPQAGGARVDRPFLS